jgi:hypothetical protein
MRADPVFAISSPSVDLLHHPRSRENQTFHLRMRSKFVGRRKKIMTNFFSSFPKIQNMISADLLTCPRNTNIVYVITVEWVALMACMLGMGAKLLPQVKENLGMSKLTDVHSRIALQAPNY